MYAVVIFGFCYLLVCICFLVRTFSFISNEEVQGEIVKINKLFIKVDLSDNTFSKSDFISVYQMWHKTESIEHPVRIELTSQSYFFYRDNLSNNYTTSSCSNTFSNGIQFQMLQGHFLFLEQIKCETIDAKTSYLLLYCSYKFS